MSKESPKASPRAETAAARSSSPQPAPRTSRAPHDATVDIRQSLAWLIPFAVLCCAIVAVPVRILADEGLPRFRALRAERADLEAQNDRLRREVRDLQREVDSLRSDPRAIERIARDELGMVRPGEVIFQFPE